MKRRTWSLIRGESVCMAGSMGPVAANSMLCRPPPTLRLSSAQLLLQELIQLARIGLAAGGLHHLADEEPEQLFLAGAVIGELPGILGQHLIDHPLDRRG